ncbi:hypothetical protein [Microcoleus sp. herbarium12]
MLVSADERSPSTPSSRSRGSSFWNKSKSAIALYPSFSRKGDRN